MRPVNDLYSFNSSHNVVLVDRKGFVKTEDRDFKNGPEPFIYIVEREFIPCVTYSQKPTVTDTVSKRLLFLFYKEEFGRFFYKEAREDSNDTE